MGTWSLSQGYSSRDLGLAIHPLLGPRLKTKYSYTVFPILANIACSEVKFIFNFDLTDMQSKLCGHF